MFIKEVLTRYRNDFSYICGCEHCGHSYRRGDGYADAYYCQQVVPNQHCPECGRNTYGHQRAASADTHPKGGDADAAPFMSGAVPAQQGDAHPSTPES